MAATVSIASAGPRWEEWPPGGTGGAEYSAFISGGYDFHCGHLTVGPIAALQYTYVSIDSFSALCRTQPFSSICPNPMGFIAPGPIGLFADPILSADGVYAILFALFEFRQLFFFTKARTTL